MENTEAFDTFITSFTETVENAGNQITASSLNELQLQLELANEWIPELERCLGDANSQEVKDEINKRLQTLNTLISQSNKIVITTSSPQDKNSTTADIPEVALGLRAKSESEDLLAELDTHANNWSNYPDETKERLLDLIANKFNDDDFFKDLIKRITNKAHELEPEYFIRGANATFAKDIYQAAVRYFDNETVKSFLRDHPPHQKTPPIDELKLSEKSQLMIQIIDENTVEDKKQTLGNNFGISVLQPILLQGCEVKSIPQDVTSYSQKAPSSYQGFGDVQSLFKDYKDKNKWCFFHARSHEKDAESLVRELNGRSELEQFEILIKQYEGASRDPNTYNKDGSFMRRLKYSIDTLGKAINKKTANATMNIQLLSKDEGSLDAFLTDNCSSDRNRRIMTG